MEVYFPYGNASFSLISTIKPDAFFDLMQNVVNDRCKRTIDAVVDCIDDDYDDIETARQLINRSAILSGPPYWFHRTRDADGYALKAISEVGLSMLGNGCEHVTLCIIRPHQHINFS